MPRLLIIYIGVKGVPKFFIGWHISHKTFEIFMKWNPETFLNFSSFVWSTYMLYCVTNECVLTNGTSVCISGTSMCISLTLGTHQMMDVTSGLWSGNLDISWLIYLWIMMAVELKRTFNVLILSQFKSQCLLNVVIPGFVHVILQFVGTFYIQYNISFITNTWEDITTWKIIWCEIQGPFC